MAARKMPPQRPGSSAQDVTTPFELVEAVEARFGPIAWDLAATAENAQGGRTPGGLASLRRYGPGSAAGEDALVQPWERLQGTTFCNPPFGNIAPWAERAARSLAAVRLDAARRHRHDWRLCLLTPANVGSNWFVEHIHGRALVLALNPRVRFVGHEDDYPQSLILSVFGADRTGFEPWRWCDRVPRGGARRDPELGARSTGGPE